MNTISKVFFIFFSILIGCKGLYAQNSKGDSEVRGTISQDFFNPPPDSMKVYMQAEVQPKFSKNLKKYLADSIHYPQEARKKNIQGTVFVSFIVEKNGSISNVTILRSPDTCLNGESKRLIYAMPKWLPGMQKGKPVRVWNSIPIYFKL
ncbi:MAG TPA: energy transducer TonB [Bacteroidia bacterium]|jgi:TonB family protein|nr:energy transducer TonB [Bacteroidia bacterium]